MGRLIRDLLDVARLDAGALIVRRAAEPVRPLLEELHQEFLPQARRKDISLELVVEPELPPGSIDADRIHQALGNLLANALKFTPGGGRIVLGAALDPEGAELVLRVSDTGPGVPEESADLLFDRFWQASRDDRTGAGLGLAIVRGITEAHGGRVEVASTPGRGATFRLHLPTADPSSPSQEAAASPAGDVAAFMGEGWSGEPADAGGGVRRGE